MPVVVAPSVPVLSWTPPQGWPDALAESLGMELWRIPVVVLSAVGVYVAALVLLRLFGSRVLTGLSAFDTVVVLMFGAVAGRVIIGHPPTLAAGVIGLTTLMVLEATLGALVGNVRAARAVAGRARVVLAHGVPLPEHMRRGHVSRTDLDAALRAAGVRHLEEAQAVVLEANGRLSVLKAGVALDPELLVGVVGAEHLADDAGRG